MKYLIMAIFMVGCESQLGGCISLSAVTNRATVSQPYCWVSGPTEYCVSKRMLQPVIKPGHTK